MGNNQDPVASALQPIANALKVGVTEVWKIFIWRYVAKGAGELLGAVAITVMFTIKIGVATNWILLPWLVSLLIAYDGLQLIINPRYFAARDIAERIKNER